MDIRVLYTIVAIAEHGSFLAASRALSLSPAAVSLHVKIIEDELGEILFDRSVRPPVLTDAGRRTLERARRVLRPCMPNPNPEFRIFKNSQGLAP